MNKEEGQQKKRIGDREFFNPGRDIFHYLTLSSEELERLDPEALHLLSLHSPSPSLLYHKIKGSIPEKLSLPDTRTRNIESPKKKAEIPGSIPLESPAVTAPDEPSLQTGQAAMSKELSPFVKWLMEQKATSISAPEMPESAPEPTETDQPDPPGEAEDLQFAKRKKKTKDRKKKKKKKKKRGKMKKAGKEPLSDNLVLSKDIISETLAELMARQGHKKTAILMYEKLSLIYPEKSSFFAQRIEDLLKIS